MGTYFEEEREHSRWDSGQAMLHRDAVKDKKDESREKGNEGYSVRNSYGTLRYLKRDKKSGSTGRVLSWRRLRRRERPFIRIRKST